MVINKTQLNNVRAEFEDASIALRFGCYDVVHPGHQVGIDYAAAQADILVVGVMLDQYIQREKGPDRPINSAENRVKTIDQADGVDVSFIAPSSIVGLAGVFLNLKPSVYVEEDEHSEKKLKSVFLNALGIHYTIDNQSRIGSTSSIIATLGLTEAIALSSTALRVNSRYQS